MEQVEKIKKRVLGMEMIFCKGGDGKAKKIPEMIVEELISKFGVGERKK